MIGVREQVNLGEPITVRVEQDPDDPSTRRRFIDHWPGRTSLDANVIGMLDRSLVSFDEARVTFRAENGSATYRLLLNETTSGGVIPMVKVED